MTKSKPKSIADYIDSAPKQGQKHLHAVYAILKKVAPKATEALKWSTPVFEEQRILFAFAGYKLHLNFMPTPSALKPFKKELTQFKTGKGSIQFPYDRPLPKALIQRIARHRVKELRERDVKWM